MGALRILGADASIAGIVGVGLSVVGLLSFTIGFTNLYPSPWGPGTPIGPIVVLGWLWGGALFVAGSLMLKYDRKMKASSSPSL